MVSIVIDSNILFSAILNLNSNIGQILITGQKFYDFYAPKYAGKECPWGFIQICSRQI